MIDTHPRQSYLQRRRLEQIPAEIKGAEREETLHKGLPVHAICCGS